MGGQKKAAEFEVILLLLCWVPDQCLPEVPREVLSLCEGRLYTGTVGRGAEVQHCPPPVWQWPSDVDSGDILMLISPCLVEAEGLGREASSQKKCRPGEAIRQQTEQTEEAVLQLSPLFVLETKIQRKKKVSWWLKPVILVPRNLRQGEHHEFEASLCYRVRSVSK